MKTLPAVSAEQIRHTYERYKSAKTEAKRVVEGAIRVVDERWGTRRMKSQGKRKNVLELGEQGGKRVKSTDREQKKCARDGSSTLKVCSM